MEKNPSADSPCLKSTLQWGFLIHNGTLKSLSDKESFSTVLFQKCPSLTQEGLVVNQTCHSTNGGSLKTTLTVPLINSILDLLVMLKNKLCFSFFLFSQEYLQLQDSRDGHRFFQRTKCFVLKGVDQKRKKRTIDKQNGSFRKIKNDFFYTNEKKNTKMGA